MLTCDNQYCRCIVLVAIWGAVLWVFAKGAIVSALTLKQTHNTTILVDDLWFLDHARCHTNMWSIEPAAMLALSCFEY